MGRGRWKEQVKCKGWSASEREMSEMQDYTLPWSECRLGDLFSLSNIEFMKKKNYIPLNYWGFYFERRMWLWACGSKGMVIRCGNHATKKSSSYSILIDFDCRSLTTASLLWFLLHIEPTRYAQTCTCCRSSWSDFWNVISLFSTEVHFS